MPGLATISRGVGYGGLATITRGYVVESETPVEPGFGNSLWIRLRLSLRLQL